MHLSHYFLLICHTVFPAEKMLINDNRHHQFQSLHLGDLDSPADINKRLSLFLTILFSGARKASKISSLPYNHEIQLISWEPDLLLGWTESSITIYTSRSFNAAGRKYLLLASWWKFCKGQFLGSWNFPSIAVKSRNISLLLKYSF